MWPAQGDLGSLISQRLSHLMEAAPRRGRPPIEARSVYRPRPRTPACRLHLAISSLYSGRHCRLDEPHTAGRHVLTGGEGPTASVRPRPLLLLLPPPAHRAAVPAWAVGGSRLPGSAPAPAARCGV